MKKLQVKISNGNSKMGLIKSVSLPPVVTCRNNAPCIKNCYARRLQRYPNVKNAYNSNLELYIKDIEKYFDDIKKAAISQRFFRWHVAGDIVDDNYFYGMVEVANECKDTNFLCFTKKYEIVNRYVANFGNIPKNLIIVFSVWNSLDLINPYGFTAAHVVPKETKGIWKEFECTGNCLECAIDNKRCWNKDTKNVYLIEH